MSRTVFCARLQRDAPGLAAAPYPGELGRRILEGVSEEAWREWIHHQTKLINEYRLSPIVPKDRQFLEQEMETFLFGAGAVVPPGFIPPPQGG
jgi:Fe-S cluster biosynthesis and repair protein YggX